MEKDKRRALRRFQTRRIIQKRLKLLANLAPSYFLTVSKKPGKLKKKHPFDCGKSNCYVCHAVKLLESKKRRRLFKKGS